MKLTDRIDIDEDRVAMAECSYLESSKWHWIHNEYGGLALVFAAHVQDALDKAVDADLMGGAAVDEADCETDEHGDEYACGSSVVRLGNASEPFDSDHLGCVVIPWDDMPTATQRYLAWRIGTGE